MIIVMKRKTQVKTIPIMNVIHPVHCRLVASPNTPTQLAHIENCKYNDNDSITVQNYRHHYKIKANHLLLNQQ